MCVCVRLALFRSMSYEEICVCVCVCVYEDIYVCVCVCVLSSL
jgi:hypothetical protein